MPSSVPVIDLTPWFGGDEAARAAVAAEVDAAPDFGTVTILDREPGRGGLQVWTEENGWEDAPHVPGAFTINTGDLLVRWSGARWKSNRHRVLPPQAEAPDEDLVSLVYFYEADHDAVIESLQPPIGRPNDYAPVVSAQFLRKLLDAITVG